MGQSSHNLPPEVVEQWKVFHEEGWDRYQDLAPFGTGRLLRKMYEYQVRFRENIEIKRSFLLYCLIAVIVFAFLIVVSGGFGYKRYVLDPYAATQVAENAASAVAEAATVVKQAEVQATQNAVTVTTQAKNRNATATAQAKNNNATATAQAKNNNAIATAFVINATETAIEANRIATASAEQEIAAEAAQLAARATEIAEDPRCLDVSGYGVKVNTENPTLEPSPGSQYVIGDAEPRVIARWEVINQGACAWVDVELRSLSTDESIKHELSRDGKLIKLVEPGQSVHVTLFFPVQAAEFVNDKWLFTLNGVRLPEKKEDNHQFLWLEEIKWINLITPDVNRVVGNPY